MIIRNDHTFIWNSLKKMKRDWTAPPKEVQNQDRLGNSGGEGGLQGSAT